MHRIHSNPFRGIIDSRSRAKGWTLGTLAERIAILPGQLSRYFSGDNAMPDHVLIKIIEVLDFDPAQAMRLRLARDFINSTDAVRAYVAGLESDLAALNQCDNRLEKAQDAIKSMMENRASRESLIPILWESGSDSSSARKSAVKPPPKDPDSDESSGFTKVFTD